MQPGGVRILDPLGNQVLFEYDAAGNVTRQTDAKGNVYSSVYDALNRRISIQYPDGAIETSVYDDRNLVSQTDAAGRQTQYEYDEMAIFQKLPMHWGMKQRTSMTRKTI